MQFTWIAGLFLVLTIMTVPVLAEAAPPPPEGVAIRVDGEFVVLSWQPGDDGGSEFNVYGWQDGGWNLIGSTPGSGFVTPGGADAYAVSSSRGGLESELISAVNSCGVYVVLGDVPPVYEENCTPPRPAMIKVH